MIHIAIVTTIGAAAIGASAIFPPLGLAIGAFVVGAGLVARGD